MEKDITVVIGAGGMGLAIARRTGSGRGLLLADFDEAALTAAAEQIRDEGHDVTAQAVDVSDRKSVLALAETAAGLGRVTRVAHTAGLSPVQAPTEMILRVDLLGVALVVDAIARVVAPGGACVVIASMAGHLMPPLSADQETALATTATEDLLELPFLAPETIDDPGTAYSLAKRANVLRVQAAAGAWGERGARINTISPGVISTPMGQQELDGAHGDQIRALIDLSAARRPGTPDDIAAAAAFLLDAQSGFITGTDLLVDGGAVAAVTALTRG